VKAALYERHGAAAEVLRGADIERPDPGPGEVRVRVEVSGVDPTDWKLRSGAPPQAIDRLQIPHHDAAEVIDAVGAGVSQERLEQQVWTWLAAAGRRWGTAAERTVIPERQAVPLPEGVSPELGASLGLHDRERDHEIRTDLRRADERAGAGGEWHHPGAARRGAL
jgi:NADPH2:quinone reductase